MYADIFKENRLPKLGKVELTKLLQKKGVEFTTDELNMVEFSKQVETPEILAKEDKFYILQVKHLDFSTLLLIEKLFL